MSYGNGGYNRLDGYGQGNPYDQRRNDFDPNGYNSGGYSQQNDMEMQNVNTSYGGSGGGVSGILNGCSEVKEGIAGLEHQMEKLRRLFGLARSDPDAYGRQIADLNSSIFTDYRVLVEKMKKIKATPGSTSQAQVGSAERELKRVWNTYQQMEASYRAQSQDEAKRKLLIVKPDATEQELQSAAENPDAPIFQQALMQSDRRGQATSVLNNVRARHEEILHIERQMEELAALFMELDQVIMEQGEVINHIAEKTHETSDNVVKANVELGHAIDSGRAARRKKWWCLLIAVIIVIIIAIVVAVVVTVMRGNSAPAPAPAPAPTSN